MLNETLNFDRVIEILLFKAIFTEALRTSWFNLIMIRSPSLICQPVPPPAGLRLSHMHGCAQINARVHGRTLCWNANKRQMYWIALVVGYSVEIIMRDCMVCFCLTKHKPSRSSCPPAKYNGVKTETSKPPVSLRSTAARVRPAEQCVEFTGCADTSTGGTVGYWLIKPGCSRNFPFLIQRKKQWNYWWLKRGWPFVHLEGVSWLDTVDKISTNSEPWGSDELIRTKALTIWWSVMI